MRSVAVVPFLRWKIVETCGQRESSPWPRRLARQPQWKRPCVARASSFDLAGETAALGLEIANPEEDQLSAFESLKLIPPKPTMGGSPAVRGEKRSDRSARDSARPGRPQTFRADRSAGFGSFDTTSGSRVMRVRTRTR